MRVNLVVLAVVAAHAVFACQHVAQRRGGGVEAPSVSHWRAEEQLRSLMVRLEEEFGVVAEDNSMALGGADRSSPVGRIKAMTDACSLSETLAASAARIPGNAAHRLGCEGDRQAFEALANTLYVQALRLNEAAASGDLRRMRADMADIRATCESCHVRFRDVAGSLSAR